MLVASTLSRRATLAAEMQSKNDDARRRYNATMSSDVHRGSMLVQRVCDYDAMAHMIMSRDTEYRRQFVAGILQHIERQYAYALANEDDQTFRRQFDRFREVIRSDSATASMLQMFLVHTAVLLEPQVERWLFPPPPDPDASDDAAVDQADVDRQAFDLYRQRYLLPMYGNLLEAHTMSVPRMVRELNAAYTALLPPDPVAAALRDNSRRIDFADDDARRRLAERWGDARRLFKGRKRRDAGDDEEGDGGGGGEAKRARQ